MRLMVMPVASWRWRATARAAMVAARAARAAEETEVIYEQKLVDDGHARHRFRADPPDHKVIEQIHKRRYGVLQQQRQRERRDQLVKVFVSDKFLHRSSGKKCGVSLRDTAFFHLFIVRRTPSGSGGFLVVVLIRGVDTVAGNEHLLVELALHLERFLDVHILVFSHVHSGQRKNIVHTRLVHIML